MGSTVLERFNKKCLERPYDVPQSWGKTYGEHKLYLEFSEEAYLELQEYAKEVGIYFSASAFDFNAVNFLAKINVPFFKVPSSDTGSLDFIEFMAKKRIPMVISTGMQDLMTMRRVYHTVKKYHDNFTFLQCTSAYPVGPENVNLNVISSYQEVFPDIPIGYSGHESGLTVSLGAVALGAKVLERHVTLDKTWKGTDHKASLDMNELADLVKQVRILELALGSPEKKMLDVEGPMKRKLGKSAVAMENLKVGTILSRTNMSIKNAEPVGFLPHEFDKLIGAKLIKEVKEDETILPDSVELYEDKNIATGKFVACILARKGSKGVPGKNIKILNGLPLVAWTILAARRAQCFDEIWVSTDCDEIGFISESFGAKYFRRDPMTALDRSSSKEGLLDFVNNIKGIWAVAYLQCTFPTQDPELLAQATSMIKSHEYDCVFSVGRSHKFRWSQVNDEKKYTRPLNFDPVHRPRRQDWAGEIVENGAFYMFLTKELLATGDYQSNRTTYVEGDDAQYCVDIDTQADFLRAELLVKKHCEKFKLSDLIPAEVSEKYRKLMHGAAKAAVSASLPVEVDSKGDGDVASK